MKSFACATLLSAFASADDCSYFYDLGCSSGDVTTNPDDWAERSFQTYLPGSDLYKEEYEGLGRVMCYNHIQYDDTRTNATVTARCRQHSSITELTYNWNDEGFAAADSYSVDGQMNTPLTLQVKANDGTTDYTITLEPVSFIW